MIIDLQQASCWRGTKQVLADVSLTVASGQFVAVMGPNGAGKSSLLKALTHELPLDKGELLIAGRDQADWLGQSELLAQQRAVMPQFHSLNFAFSVQEVVRLGRLPYTKASRAGNDVAVAQAMAAAGVTTLASRAYTRLSGGQKARVQFARVLAQLMTNEGELPENKLLLLDEPTASLDLKFQHQVLDMSRQLCQRGNAVVTVLHDLNLAAQYASHLMLMKDGRTLSYGPVGEIFTSEHLNRCFDVDVTVRDDLLDGRLIAIS